MSTESTTVTSMVDSMHGAQSRNLRTHVHVALNSARLTAGQLRSVGEALGVPTSGSVGDLRLIIEGKITDLSRDPCNIPVLFSKDKDDRTLRLSDHEGVFLTVNPKNEGERSGTVEELRDHELLESSEPTKANELEVIRNERHELQATVHTLTQEKADLQEQLQALQQALEASRTWVKDIWKISCKQVEEFEETSTAKDREIAELKLRLEAWIVDRGHSATPSLVGSEVEVPTATQQHRRRKAPPIEMFSGEDLGIHLDD